MLTWFLCSYQLNCFIFFYGDPYFQLGQFSFFLKVFNISCSENLLMNTFSFSISEKFLFTCIFSKIFYYRISIDKFSTLNMFLYSLLAFVFFNEKSAVFLTFILLYVILFFLWLLLMYLSLVLKNLIIMCLVIFFRFLVWGQQSYFQRINYLFSSHLEFFCFILQTCFSALVSFEDSYYTYIKLTEIVPDFTNSVVIF